MEFAGTSILKYPWRHNLHPYYWVLRYFGFKPFQHTWEADHIVEVREGGKNELSNFQTLCMPCHKEKTKETGQRLTRVYIKQE
jgi:hypothetical protein